MVSTYEKVRLQTIEENKKRFKDLKLNQLAIDFDNKVKPRVLIQKKKKLEEPVRRKSNRLLGKLPPVSEEVIPAVTSDIDRENSTRKAQELYTNITRDDGFPCFVKFMHPSYVDRGFELALPRDFCTKHLPKCDETITLVGQDGEEFPTEFKYRKNSALVIGWKDFARHHDLIHGDSLVFQLVEPTKFKIYVIRAKGMVN
ncbi:hypothetical protein MKW94_024626 [Papaver nudicaule]|uniref:TF-B3 domain-containing protein n=1 Tax=Papaver nudicaule TaxID=74823 RepID=A0AA41S911_PAPNU|nr:hypothetical protein [Papaver nudicaule]